MTDRLMRSLGFAVMCFAVTGCFADGFELGAQCDLTSDCQRPLVCRLERCRVQCKKDVDCPRGTHCVSDNDGLGSCLVPDETMCDTNSPCPPGTTCAVELDRLCRVPCMNDDPCLPSQACMSGFCFDVPEDEPDGGIPDGGIPDGGMPDALIPDGGCIPPIFSCDMDPATCETNTLTDRRHCGRCNRPCNDQVGGEGICAMGTCDLDCDDGLDHCNSDLTDGCETSIANDEANCGVCGNSCGAGLVCIENDCRNLEFPSSGADPFEPSCPAGTTECTVSIAPGVHEYTDIRIPEGVTLQTTVGSGVLELRASGDVVIAGTIDLSGGSGSYNANIGVSPGGGTTGTPTIGTGETSGCGPRGLGGVGAAGMQGTGSMPVDPRCAAGGNRGGGMGGLRSGGGGGGGPGGGGGGGSMHGPGGAGGTPDGGQGGPNCMGGQGGQASPGYAGSDGGGNCDGATAGGGGGGSIGMAASMDLEVRMFQPGSGGGGAGSLFPASTGGSGGGGGGGALRITSHTRIEVTGQLLANGGNGGDIPATEQRGSLFAGGGGGSGGVIYLAAPEVRARRAVVQVEGGLGMVPPSANSVRFGGNGGIGRIRISTDPRMCTLDADFGSLTSPSGCTPSAAPGAVSVGLYSENN